MASSAFPNNGEESDPDGWLREINGMTVKFLDGGVVEESPKFDCTSSGVYREKVVCWYDKPTRTAWLCWGGKGEKAAKAVSGCFGTGIYKVRGNEVKCDLPALTDNAWLVRVFGIPSYASKQQILQDVPKVLHPKRISLDELPSTDDLPSNNEDIELLLEYEAGTVVSFDPVTHPAFADDDRYGVTAEFITYEDAMRALQLNGSTLEFNPAGTLTVGPVYAAWIKVPSGLRKAAAWDADSQRDYRELLRRVSITEFPLAAEGCRLVVIEGLIREKVVAAKKTLEVILHGEVVQENGTAVWIPLCEDTGRLSQRVDELMRGLRRAVVIRDAPMCQLRLVGDLSQRMEAKTRLIKIANKSKRLSGHECDLTLQGADCVICLTEAEDPVQTSCGHTLCRGCLLNLCTHAVSNEEKGIQCHGNDGTCNFAFPLAELKCHISAPKLEGILEMAFNGYVSRNPHKIRFCPTPDCNHVYLVSPNRPEDGQSAPIHPCARCPVSVCTWCHVPAHAGATCDEHQDMMTGGYRALAQAKMELDIRDCPRCGMLIQKNGGCNRIQCGRCKTYICWQCMETFDPGQGQACYVHMQRVHGSIGPDQFFYPDLM
ncbi:hypothetical protein GE09DRAFT_1276834 [Coniochaeta sp. 2T2.1]|nr:hypothetical protein GE09DRAFT_1276834 [Coniochaeta sp. 2T2.1]